MNEDVDDQNGIKTTMIDRDGMKFVRGHVTLADWSCVELESPTKVRANANISDELRAKIEAALASKERGLRRPIKFINNVDQGDHIVNSLNASLVAVPEEPTTRMLNAGMIASGCRVDVGAIYRAMLAAVKEPGR